MTAPAHVHACYRHPDRVAGITCQRCDRPICPACMHQASVGFHCPECARAGRQVEHRGLRTLRARPVATQVLIGVNLAVYVLGLLLGGTSGLTGRGTGDIVIDGGLWVPYVPEEPWRLLTSGFLHAGLIHVGMNMWVLWILGNLLEPALGRARFLALYVASLGGGALGVVLADAIAGRPSLTVGASGAIYGLMGGAVVLARVRNVNLWQSGLVTILGLNLFLTFAIPGISIGGHLGGLAGGLAAGAVAIEAAPRLGRAGPAVATALTCLLAVVFLVGAYALSDAVRTTF